MYKWQAYRVHLPCQKHEIVYIRLADDELVAKVLADSCGNKRAQYEPS